MYLPPSRKGYGDYTGVHVFTPYCQDDKTQESAGEVRNQNTYPGSTRHPLKHDLLRSIAFLIPTSPRTPAKPFTKTPLKLRTLGPKPSKRVWFMSLRVAAAPEGNTACTPAPLSLCFADPMAWQDLMDGTVTLVTSTTTVSITTMVLLPVLAVFLVLYMMVF